MVGNKPEHWRVLTPTAVVINLVATLIVGYLPVHTIERFEKHLDRIDEKFDIINSKHNEVERKLALVQGQCCKRSIDQTRTIMEEAI